MGTGYATDTVVPKGEMAFDAAWELFGCGDYAGAAAMLKFYDPEPGSAGFRAKAQMMDALEAHDCRVEPCFKAELD